MYGGIFQGSAQVFWREYKIGGRGGWATYTVEALLLILICQLAAKIRLRLGSFSSTITQFRSAAVVSPSNNYLKLKNPAVSPSIHPHNRVSEAILDLDLRNLIDTLDERSYELQKWDTVIDRQQNLLAYSAKSFKPKWRSHLRTSEGTGPYWILDGPLKYLSVTIFENCSAEMLRNFYMDNDYRKKWDKTLAVHEQLEVDESNGTEIGRIIKKFPLLTAREYILAWRVWEAKDGTSYCFSKDCEHPLAPRQKKYVRVEFFKSGWRIRKVPGRNACEIKMVHQEDAGLNAEMAKLAFSKGIWSYVCKMDHALRQYTAAKCLQSSLGATAVTLIQKVPEGLDSMAHIFGPAYPENSATNCGQIALEGSERKFLRRPSNKLMAKGLILLGGVFCMSRGHSNLGAKVACAYILSKLTKRGASTNRRRQA